MDSTLFDACAFLDLLSTGGQPHLHHLGSDLMHIQRFPDHHYGLTEMLHTGSPHLIWSNFSHIGENDEDSLLSLVVLILVYFEFSCFLLFENLVSRRLYSESELL